MLSLAQREVHKKQTGKKSNGGPERDYLAERQYPLTTNLKACRFTAQVCEALGGISVTGGAIALQLFKYGELNYSRDCHGYASIYHSKLSTRRKVFRGVDELVEAGAVINIKQVPGSHNRTRSVLVGTDKLYSVVSGVVRAGSPVAIKDDAELRKQVTTPEPRRLVVLRDSNKVDIDYNTNARHVKRLESKLRKHGELLKNSDITGVTGTGEVPAMICVFNNGTWKDGGRPYGPHQNMPKEDRAKIKIDGEPTVELDFTAIHPGILYAFYLGKPVPDDCYDIPLHGEDYATWPREHIKAALVILINATTHQGAQLALAADIENKDREADGLPLLTDSERPTKLHRGYAAKLIAAVKKHHAPIAQWFHSGEGVKLQRLDSRIAEAVWWTMCTRGIVVLPVHDSFIVQERHADMLRELMESACKKIIEAVLKIK